MDEMAAAMPKDVELSVEPFSAFTLTPSDGKVGVNATVKVGGSLYFLTSAVKAGDDGPRAAVFSDRMETFCGKPVRGANQLRLEALMDIVHEVSVSAVTQNPNLRASLVVKKPSKGTSRGM